MGNAENISSHSLHRNRNSYIKAVYEAADAIFTRFM